MMKSEDGEESVEFLPVVDALDNKPVCLLKLRSSTSSLCLCCSGRNRTELSMSEYQHFIGLLLCSRYSYPNMSLWFTCSMQTAACVTAGRQIHLYIACDHFCDGFTSFWNLSAVSEQQTRTMLKFPEFPFACAFIFLLSGLSDEVINLNDMNQCVSLQFDQIHSQSFGESADSHRVLFLRSIVPDSQTSSCT